MNPTEIRAICALQRELPTISDVQCEPEGRDKFPDFGLRIRDKRVALEVSSCQRDEVDRYVENFFKREKGESLCKWGIKVPVFLKVTIEGLVKLVKEQPSKRRARLRMLEAFWEALLPYAQSIDEDSVLLDSGLRVYRQSCEDVEFKFDKREFSVRVELQPYQQSYAEGQCVVVEFDGAYLDGDHAQAVFDALQKKHDKYRGGASPDVACVRKKYDELWILLEDHLAEAPFFNLQDRESMSRMQKKIGVHSTGDGDNPSRMLDRIGLFSEERHDVGRQIVWVKGDEEP